MTPAKESDFRYLPRWEVNNRVLYQLESESDLRQGQTRDLSCAGACIKASATASPSQKIKMTVFLSPQSSVMLEGRVLWSRAADNTNIEMGITFENPSLEVQDLILQHAFEVDRKSVVKHWFDGWDPSTADPKI